MEIKEMYTLLIEAEKELENLGHIKYSVAIDNHFGSKEHHRIFCLDGIWM